MLRRSIALAFTAGSLVLSNGQQPATHVVPPRGGGGALSPAAIYSRQAREHYLSKEDFDYIRPGLNVSIVSVSNVAAGQNPVVEVNFTDDLDQPLDRNGKVTPGPIEVEFILARWDAGPRQYFNYTTATFGPVTFPLHDIGGSWTDLGLGDSRYTFATTLPANFDATQTVTLGIYAGRVLTDIIGKDYSAPAALKSFRPDGGTPTPVFDEIRTESCNSCHDPLAFHTQFEGRGVRDVGLCVLCHTPQMPTFPNGETLDFKILIHKLHDGNNLPSVKAGTPYVPSPGGDDFSTVVFPQDIRNCEKCHAPSASAPDSMVWFTKPSRAACGSCHDDIDFATGANHPAGPYNDDSACASCHAPQGDHEYDASIMGAHTVPYKSKQLKGVNAKILSVTNTAPGQKPTIQFQLTQNDGTPIDPAALGANLNVSMGGPTTDYGVDPFNFRQRADGASFDGTTATYTFNKAIPAEAKGTWAFSIEARRTVTLNPAPRLGPATVNDSALNPVFYAAVTDASPVPRRQVVSLDNCNKCHDQLAAHGRSRRNPDFCVLCHNPNEFDRRPASLFPPENIDFKRHIHRIHTGENLTQDFTIIGPSGNPDNFNDVRFPGDRRDCLKCHVPGAYQVPEDDVLATRLPTITLRDWYSPMQPVAAACLGCHDEKHVAAHAFVMTAPFGEACMACHGPDADFAVDKVHAR